MGSSKDCIFWHRNKQTIISFFLLLFLSFTHGRLRAEGNSFLLSIPTLVFVAEGAVSKRLEPCRRSQLQKAYERRKMEEKGEVVVKRSLIGSRPPSCAMKCRGCEHCVAIQVPVFSHGFLQRTRRRGRTRSPFSTAYYSRGDDFSNYMPVTWKCRCGTFLLNP